MEKEEVWRDVVGYEGRYQVSNQGRARSLDWVYPSGRRHKGIVLQPAPDKDGYMLITLHKGGKQKVPRLHRLVAEAFLPKELDKSKNQINHKNEVKSDNNVDNLEWVTQTENINYGTHTLNMVSNTDYKSRVIDYTKVVANTDYKARSKNMDYSKVRESTRRPVYGYKLKDDGTFEERVIFDTITEASKHIGVTLPSLTPVLNGKRKSSNGWFVEYAPRPQDSTRIIGYKLDRNANLGPGILFTSIEFASKYTGTKKKSVNQVLYGKAHMSNGWTFVYA